MVNISDDTEIAVNDDQPAIKKELLKVMDWEFPQYSPPAMSLDSISIDQLILLAQHTKLFGDEWFKQQKNREDLYNPEPEGSKQQQPLFRTKND